MSRRLDDRYELLDELPHVTGGRLFRARDLAFGEIVSVKQLGQNCGLEAEARQLLENTVRHLQCLPHPHLSRVYHFDPRNGLIVQEWVQGISLLDLLRRRRELSIGEALHLLSTLPATLDFLAREAVPIPRPLLGKLFVEFVDGGVAESLLGTPVDRWPAYILKLNPLSLRGLMADSVTDETKHTVVVDPRRPTEIQEGYGPRELALLLYELLGGRIREVDSRRYSPLSSLREAGNAVLRRELLAMPHADCASLWRDLLHAQSDTNLPSPPKEATTAPVRKYHIPEAFLTSARPGSTLNLEPEDSAVLPIRLTTGPRFTVGRSAGADFVARILPESEANDARTNRLSRVHALLEINDGHITLRDGNGRGPSLNGSSLDGQPLTPNHPTVLPQRGRLDLGDEYVLDLIPLAATEASSWEIDNLDAWAGPDDKAALTPDRALVCQPVDGHATTRHGVWLFSEVGFGLDAAGSIVWDTRGRGRSPAAFHYFRGCFWLRNDSLAEPVLAGRDTLLGRGEMLPLAPGQTLRIGTHVFAVQIE
ncbi:MAG: FHA domain-containing protein [Chthoniobacter sp.]|uniref:FHA domain-containing protein n=1 Tax=Chthoniobacter sp. TaxID=2510640 RepID=UPI0032A56175